MDKQVLYVADDNLQYIINKVNMPVGGASVQSYSWLQGFSQFFDVKALCKYGECSKEHNQITTYGEIKDTKVGVFKKISQLKRIFRSTSPKAVFVSVAGLNAFMFGVASKATKTFYIQRISNDISFDKVVYKKKLGLLKYYLALYGIKRADLILCQNNRQYQNLIKIVNPNKVQIIYNPFEVKHELFKIKSQRDYIAWVGLFQHQKNMELLYDIALRFKKIKFKIAGKPIKKIDEKSKLAIDNLKKLSNVELVGLLDRSEIFPFLHNAKFLLNTSRYEGFTNTFLEAFSTNTPVITTRKIDPDGIIERNGLGCVFENDQDMLLNLNTVLTKKNVNTFNTIEYLRTFHNPKSLANKVTKLINLHYVE